MNRPVYQDCCRIPLRLLDGRSADALRIVNKARSNSDYLGVIYSVFPKARVIYMGRDPIDTCLSSYFQHFLPGLTFTLDLSDLAHYYPGPSAPRCPLACGAAVRELSWTCLTRLWSADQASWSHKILDFLWNSIGMSGVSIFKTPNGRC